MMEVDIPGVAGCSELYSYINTGNGADSEQFAAIFRFAPYLVTMNSFLCLVAMYCVAVQAMPSGYGGGHGGEQLSLVGIPDESSYAGLVYPQLDIQDLGSSSHGDLPAEQVKVIRTIKISVPHPVPIKVPHKVPFPVPVVKPYPVHVTKLVEVPHPVPVEVVKKIPVPVEIPKPYPVPQQEFNSQAGSGSSGYDNAWQPTSASGQGYQLPSGGQYEGEGYGGHADQSAGYASVVPAQQNYGEQQQQQQQQEQQQSYADGQDHQ